MSLALREASVAKRPFWTRPLAEVRERAADAGLSTDEATARRARFGLNEVALERERPALVDFLARFASPLVVVLLVASAIAGVLGDPKSFAIISCMVVVSVVLDFAQERRAKSAARKLQRQVEVQARVLRDGKPCDVPARELVPGDVVILEPGDLVPADARLLSAHGLQLQESSLTGEPAPVDKSPGDIETTNPADATNAVFAGTSVVAGTARALVTETGNATQFAHASVALHHSRPLHPFEAATHTFGLLVVRFTLLLVMFVLTVHAMSGRPFIESLLFALALAVGLTPELLPMIVSVTLARGAMRMAKSGVIVKRLAAIHDLGGMDVLCTDKTGTLTQARIAVASSIDLDGVASEVPLAWARAAATLSRARRSGIDEALLARTDIVTPELRALDELPFDPSLRFAGVLVADGERNRLIVKGAAEQLVLLSTLDAAALERTRARIDALAREGLRVIAVGTRDVQRDRVEAEDVAGIELLGLVAFVDPPKEDCAEAIGRLERRGVAVKIVTGDNELVTRHVARAIGLEAGDALHGDEIDELDDDALRVRVRTTDLFCRVTPVQKNRVVRAFEAAGHVVGYLGDGINDGPPLRSAHVGISVDSAVDVAKDAADLILCRPDLGVLEDGVVEGRRTVANVTKYVLMATSSNFGNMVSMALASLFLPFLPLLPVQILVNNSLYDVSEVALPFDDVDAATLERPVRWDIGAVRRFMLTLGPVSSLFDVVTFIFLWKLAIVDVATFRTGWFVESIVSQVAVIFVIRTPRTVFESVPNRWVTAAAFSIMTAAVALPYTPLGAFLSLVPLPARVIGPLAAIVVAYLCTAEFVKRRAFVWAAR